MAGGVPAGAAIAIQVELSPSDGRPAASLRLGTSGNSGSGRLVYFASARYWLPRTSGSDVPVESSAKSTVPDSTAGAISAEPLKGTSCTSMPAVLANSTAPSREVTVPAPMFIVPGLALACAINSWIDFGPAIRVTTSDMLLTSRLID